MMRDVQSRRWFGLRVWNQGFGEWGSGGVQESHSNGSNGFNVSNGCDGFNSSTTAARAPVAHEWLGRRQQRSCGPWPAGVKEKEQVTSPWKTSKKLALFGANSLKMSTLALNHDGLSHVHDLQSRGEGSRVARVHRYLDDEKWPTPLA